MATRRRVNPKANRKKLIRALLIVIILLVAIAFVSYLVNKDKPCLLYTSKEKGIAAYPQLGIPKPAAV